MWYFICINLTSIYFRRTVLHLKSLAVVLVILIISLMSPSINQSAALPADLADLSLEDLMRVTVYSASKFEQKTSEAPSSVTIITASEIEKYGYRTLADILRSVRSFYTTYDRNYSYLGIRGFARPGDYNSRALLLVDGVRINDGIYNTAAIGTDFILDVDLVDRVEVIRGPGSSLYGSNAFFAVINIITKKGEQIKGIEVSADAGSFDTYRGRVTYGNKVRENIEMLLSATYYDSNGDKDLYYPEFDAPETNNGIAENSDIDRFHSFFGRASFYDFTLEGAFVKRKKLIPTASFETFFNDTRNATTDQSAFIDLKYVHTYASDWNVLARITYSQNNYDGRYVYDYAEEGDEEPYIVANKDYADSAWWGTEAQVSKKFFDKHRLILGGEYRDSFRQHQGNYDEDVYLDSEEDSTVWGVYAQDEFPIMSNLILNAGIRHDHYSTFGGSTNPRLALVYSPLEQTILKVLYGKAFRAPSAYELYYHDGYIRQKPNPDLDPETIQTYELILEQRIGEHLLATINGFYYKIEDLINGEIDSSDNLITYKNVQEVEAKGIELELQGQWLNGLGGRLSYSYQLCEDSKTDKILTNSPKHLAKLAVTIPLYEKKLFLGIEEYYMSERKTIGRNHVDESFITNVTLFSHQLFRTLKVSASLYNLFDERYSDPASVEHLQDSIEQDGRSFRFKVTYTF
jgi:outer membrane receptor for ferrienterochelin and colicins